MKKIKLPNETEKVGPDVRGTRPLIITFVQSQQRDEVLRKVTCLIMKLPVASRQDDIAKHSLIISRKGLI